ncbi:hypothetical protein ACN38_g10852 [Penicillium nordicum]|uniref:Uncharacterized protein n=1 Tax=Penicillium nordicum TaxID=229535 RepID=A0A0M8NTC8_9EURO|nr:hypothetical protein ACN38_g10852 [Penicillium nordicum]
MQDVPLTKKKRKAARSLNSPSKQGPPLSISHYHTHVQMVHERGAEQEKRRENGEEYRRQGRNEAPFHSYMIPPNLEGASRKKKKKNKNKRKGRLLIAQ